VNRITMVIAVLSFLAGGTVVWAGTGAGGLASEGTRVARGTPGLPLVDQGPSVTLPVVRTARGMSGLDVDDAPLADRDRRARAGN